MSEANYIKPIFGSEQEIEARDRLLKLFQESPLPEEDRLTNLGLYTRSLIVAKILYLNELYQKILPIPGVVMEFGVWWGANFSLLNSFRSVYEPYNMLRKVIGFDTFEGYTSISDTDGESPHVHEGGFSVSEGYMRYLTQVLDAHEAENVMPHIKKYELIKGDVTDTIQKYFTDHPETIVSLAYFDLALYKPTKACLEAIRPHLVKGSILAMDELNCRDFPGETIALKEVLGLNRYQILRSQFLPDRSYVIID